MSRLPWFQQPSYTGNIGGLVPAAVAMGGALPFGMGPQGLQNK
jgi:hypothetical protein